MKKLMLCFIFSLLLFFNAPIVSNAQMEDGTYSLQYQVNKPGSIDVSIANDYFVKPAQLFVENGKMYVQLTIKNSAWVTEFNGQNGGNFVISRDSGTDTRLVQFDVASLNEPTVVKMKVDIEDLNYHHEYSTDFVWHANSLQLIEAAKKPEVASSPAPQNTQINHAQQAATEKAQAEAEAKAAAERERANASTEKQQAEVKAAAEKTEAEVVAEKQQPNATTAATEKEQAAATTKETEEKATTDAAQQAAEDAEQQPVETVSTNIAEVEQQKVGSTESQEKELASATTNSTEPSIEKSNLMTWVFIIVGIVIIGGVIVATMRKRTV